MYRDYLKAHPDEWNHLAGLCRITISRFYRDRAVFNALRWKVLPELASSRREEQRLELRCWCCGCASGEEVYTLKMLWSLCEVDFPNLEFEITATDIDSHLLTRARQGVYPGSSLRELPLKWRSEFFKEETGAFRIKGSLTDRIHWLEQDVLSEMPEGTFDLVLCRNLVFTYFEPILQHKVLRRFETVTQPGAALVIGQMESLPSIQGFHPWLDPLRIYRRVIL
jgi:chemotaxis protein methyltransferase CheR